jgi:hypothetical protein
MTSCLAILFHSVSEFHDRAISVDPDLSPQARYPGTLLVRDSISIIIVHTISISIPVDLDELLRTLVELLFGLYIADPVLCTRKPGQVLHDLGQCNIMMICRLGERTSLLLQRQNLSAQVSVILLLPVDDEGEHYPQSATSQEGV